MKRIISLAMALFMLMGIMPLSLAAQVKDETLDPVLNAPGGNLVFDNDVENPWVTAQIAGVEYAKSAIESMDDTTTRISTTATINAGKLITFDYVISTEENYDKFTFGYIAPTATGEIVDTKVYVNSGEAEGSYTFKIERTAEYTLYWEYKKDVSSSDGSDSVYIRNIAISEPPAPTSFDIVQDSVEVITGMTNTLTVTYAPEYSYADLNWTSSNNNVVTVENGVLTGVSAGEAVVTGSYNGMSDTVQVTVRDGGKYIEGFRIYSEMGNSTGRFRNYMFEDGSNTVALLPCEVPMEVITAAEYYDGMIYFVANGMLYSMDYETGLIADEIGQVGTVRDMTYDYALGRMLGIISDEEEHIDHIVEIDLGTAEVTTVASISSVVVTIAATREGAIFCVEILTGNILEVNLDTSETTVVISTGIRAQYMQSMTFDFDTGMLYWASCSTSTEDLYVIDLGTNTMTLVQEGFGEAVGLHMVPDFSDPVPVTGVSLNETNINLDLGETFRLTPSFEPSNATNRRVEWTTSNASIASVERGVVKANGSGTAIITVTTVDGGFTATCSVTVTGDYLLYEDFEDVPYDWMFADEDGDGYCWLSVFEFSNGMLPAYEGMDMYASQSFINGDPGTGEGQTRLDPDNWMMSPAFTIAENATSVELSWIAGSMDSNWLEHYSVYIGTGSATPSNFTTVLYSEDAPGTATPVSISLMDYVGQTVRIAFRHHDSYDRYMLNIDMIQVQQVVEGGSSAVPTTGVTLNQSNASMSVGDTLTLTATVSPANATNKNVVWTSSNNSVATVVNGVVTAVAAGTAIITVTTENGGFTATCTVTVEAGEPDYLLYEDFEDELEGWTLVDADGDGYNWFPMSDFSAISAYEGYDMFTSQSYITANYSPDGNNHVLDPDNWLISPEFTISANASSVKLKWIAGSLDLSDLDNYSVYIGVGAAVPETFTTVLYTGEASWDYEDIEVDLSAYAGQRVRIAFRHHDSSGRYMLNIDLIRVEQTVDTTTVPVTGVTLNTTSADMQVGDTLTLTATVTPANATNKNVTWSSSNNAVATVANGVVTAVAPGTATITVTTEDGGFTYFCIITVAEQTVPVTGVTLNTASAEMNVGGTLTLNATVTPENATNKNVVWTTSNETVATVADGVVTAISAGEAVITVTTEDGAFTATCTITVINPTVPVTGITLDIESAVMIIGGQLTINATVVPEDATNKNIVWTTSDEAVATVENGIVTAIAYGEVTITATTEDGAFTATCAINVYEMGDVTGDGMFNTGDAVAMLRKIAGLDNPTYVAELEDYNGDGQFNTGDAVAILRKIAGLE